MEKKATNGILKTKFLKCFDFILNLFAIVEFVLIVELHLMVPFFPVLFLFNLCFWIGYPLFVKYVLKKKWFECTKDYYLKIKYILLPWLIMGFIVLLYYHKATFFIITTIMEDNGWK